VQRLDASCLGENVCGCVDVLHSAQNSRAEPDSVVRSAIVVVGCRARVSVGLSGSESGALTDLIISGGGVVGQRLSC
jgi:hypothetical protein